MSLVLYHEKTAYDICHKVAMGKTLLEITQLPGYPDLESFISWLAENEPLRITYTRAREMSAYSLEEEALALARLNAAEPGSPSKQKSIETLISQLRWSATKRNPQAFSDKAAVNVVVPIQINTTLDMGKTAGGGNAQFPNIYDLKAETIEEVDHEPGTPLPGPRLVQRKKQDRRPKTPEQAAKQKERLAALRAKNRPPKVKETNDKPSS